MSKNCKKKSSTKNLAVAVANTFANKLAKLERQVRKNPSDHVAAYNLAIFKSEGSKGKGYAG